jgi:hypothetical protein
MYIDNVSVKEVTSFGGGGLETEAYKLVEDTSSGSHRAYANVTVTAEMDYTTSIYIKANEVTKVRIIENAIIGVSMSIKADLALGTITYEGTQVDNSSITELANGWYRISMSGATNAGQTLYRYEISLLDDSGSDSYTGDGTSGVYVAYAQLEEQASATSLMLPAVEGSTSSRVADVVDNGGSQALFGGVNASGVLYAEIAALADDGLTSSKWISISDGTADSSLRIGFSGDTNSIRAYLNVDSVAQSSMIHTVTDVTEFSKVGFRWAENDFSLWVDGVEVETDISASTFTANTLTELAFNSGTGNGFFYGKTKGVAVFNYLSDTEMTKLTTV